MEYTPAEVKRAVVGYGRAEKTQVQHMVKLLLGLDAAPEPHDAADALAVAICHVHARRNRMRESSASSGRAQRTRICGVTRAGLVPWRDVSRSPGPSAR